MENKLKSIKGVTSASVTHNHPDHPGKTYISVEHQEHADNHVQKIISQHGTIDHDDSYATGEGKGHHHYQAIVTPHKKLKKNKSMDKLEELEKALRTYQELLKNAMMSQGGQPGGMTQPAEATMKAEKLDDGKEEKKDEKKDKKMIEDKLDEHNEKKHGEAKDEDSAKKSDLSKSVEVINFNNNSQWSIDD